MFLAILKPMKKDDYLYALIFEISYTDADGIIVFEAAVWISRSNFVQL